jgi:glycerol kinase
LETTTLGAAYLAGMQVGMYPAPSEFAKDWKLETRFSPQLPAQERAAKYAGWQDAVSRTLSIDKDKRVF